MKRCPECTFLYEDEQDRCDWDGHDLRFTNFLPPIVPPQPIAKVRLKSIWGGFTIPLLVLALVSTVLVTLYRAAPPTFSASSSLKEKLPGANQDTNPPASDASRQLVTAPEIPPEPAEPSTVQSTRPQVKARNRPVPLTNEKVIKAVPATHIQIEPATPNVSTTKPATTQASPAPPASQKPAASSYSISAHPEPPPASPAPQSKTQTQEKDSKFKSLLKKAGRVLKKPF
jgi:cell division protein FtsN